MVINDYEELEEWCASINLKYNELEKSLVKWKLKLASLALHNDFNNKTWIHLSLQDVKEKCNDIIRLMSMIQTSLADKDSRSDYYKYAIDELKYFTYDWEFIFRSEVEKIFRQHEKIFEHEKGDKDDEQSLNNIVALRHLGETLKENENLMKFIQTNIFETRETVINIKELSDQGLQNIQKGQSRVRQAKMAQSLAINLRRATYCCIGIIVTIVCLIVFNITGVL